MESKDKYIDALKCITEAYCSVAKTQEGINNFKIYLRLFKGLVDECFEPKQETNLDHYKKDIAEHFIDDLAMVNKKIRVCWTTSCSDCEFSKGNGECIGKSKIKAWLKQPYKKPTYKLTQCEYDMLDTIFEKDARFSAVYLIGELKRKGYFENIKCGHNVLIKDILANCEVKK